MQETSRVSSPPEAGPGLSLTSLPAPQSLPGTSTLSGATGNTNLMSFGLSLGSLSSGIGGAFWKWSLLRPEQWKRLCLTHCFLGEGEVGGSASSGGAAEGTGSGGLSGPEVSSPQAGAWGPTRCLCVPGLNIHCGLEVPSYEGLMGNWRKLL